jgi:hypothetical protein
MGNNASKTPAPLVDRVKGSRTNKAGSAASKKSAQGIKLNASIISGLTKKAKEYNEKHPKGKVSVTTLKAVMRRGMGAYSSSHRPTITGGAPNTRQAWAYARVNAFLRKKGGQGAKPTYVQDNDLLANGGQLGKEITCVNCGWHWNTNDSDPSDKYVCHKCGYDNRTYYDKDPIGEYNKYEIYKSIGPLRQANEIIEKIEYMEGGGKVKNPFIYDNYTELQKALHKELWSGDNVFIFKYPNISTAIIFRGANVPYDKRNDEKAKLEEFYEDGFDYQNVKRVVQELYNEDVANRVVKDLENKNLVRFDVEKNIDIESYKNILAFDPYNILFLRKGEVKEKNDKNLAPNGKPSNLNNEQYKLVRTTEFKNWFGDWENDPKNASQVVDENGEPLVVYRGDSSASKKGNIFKTGYNRLKYVTKDRLPNQYFFYFVDKLHVANGYGVNGIEDHNSNLLYDGKKGKLWYPEIKQYFLNIRKPIDLTPRNPNYPTYDEYLKAIKWKSDNKEDKNIRNPRTYGYKLPFELFDKLLRSTIGNYIKKEKFDSDFHIERLESKIESKKLYKFDEEIWAYFVEYERFEDWQEILRRIVTTMQQKKFDGLVFLEDTNFLDFEWDNLAPNVKYDVERWKLKPFIYAAMYPEQIKLADGTNTKFDAANPDIRFAHGGLTKSLAVADVHKKYPELPKSFINAQLYLGMKAEMEHTKNPDVAKKIALDHLNESPFYYQYLTKMEKELEGLDVKEHYNEQKNYAKGGEINPDNKGVKDYFAHGSGNVGGVLIGKRHSEGGIKAVNKSTNQPLEMEGGEVVITRNAVSDNEKREFEGEMLTNKEILSRINESGGGVSFADGGDIPESIYTSGKEYAYGGKMVKDHDIVSSCGCKHTMADGGKLNTEEFNEMYGHTFKNGGQIYGEGGMVRIINKEIPTYYGFQELFNGLKVPNLRKEYEGFLKENYKINFTQLPQKIRTGLLLGSQKLIDKYINK